MEEDNTQDNDVLYEGSIYQVFASSFPVLSDKDYSTYQVYNKITNVVEYEDNLLPAAITVAIRSEAALELIKSEEDKKNKVTDKETLQ